MSASESSTVPSPNGRSTEHIDPATVDLAALSRWMDARGLPAGEIASVAPLSGGTQNIMVRFTRGDRGYVLRRGPAHLRARSDDAIRREARVLTALAATDVAVPRMLAACPDPAVLGAAFYLMAPVEGFNPTVELPARYADDASARHRTGLLAADELARLGAVDHVAVGLGDLGRPDGFLARQVPQWLAHLARYDEFDGYPGGQLPDIEELAAWLRSGEPPEFRPGLMHGDFHLANLMYARDDVRLAAIVDWEMCTVGDPLLDLGWLVATWPTYGTALAAHAPLARAGGLAAPAELVEQYAAQSTRDLSHIDWYVVLACFKLAIVIEETHARACAGLAPPATGDYLHGLAVQLCALATRVAANGI